jgi:hypothetical protein
MPTLGSRHVSPRGALLALFVATLTSVTCQRVEAQVVPLTTCADSSNPPSVWTAQYGNLRQSYNNKETLLTSGCLSNGSVTLTQPGWSPLTVDHTGLPGGATVNPVVAQPLYLAQVPASAGLPNCPTVEACNLLIVVTLNGSVFAFNGGDITHGGGTGAGQVVWQRTGTTSGDNNNYFWFDDCTGGTLGPSTFYGVAGMPFAGNVSAGPIWCSNSSSCSSSTSAFTENSSTGSVSFAIPTINDGYIYIPTSGITSGSPCSTTECSGVLVYTGH